MNNGNQGEFFKNRQAALQWLQQRGQVSRSKFYDDCSTGLITIQPDKSLSKFEVAMYAEKLFGASRSTVTGSGTLAVQRETDEARKIRAEAELKELQAEEARRKIDRQWLHKEEAWSQMAAIIGLLRDALRHQFHAGAAAIVLSSGGEPARSPEVYEVCEGLIGKAFNEIASLERIEGVFVKPE